MNFLKKHLTGLCIMAIVLTNYSCSNDDDSPTVTIESVLSTSKVAYQNANSGDRTQIMQSEYDLLATVLNKVSMIGTKEYQYNFEPRSFRQSEQTLANNNGINIPTDSYVFAFKYHTIRTQVPSIIIKQSSINVTEGYSDLGNPTPEHSGGGNVYFVIKGNDSKIASEGFLAIYMGEGNAPGYRIEITESMNVSNGGNVNSLNNQPNNWLYLYQGLNTTQNNGINIS